MAAKTTLFLLAAALMALPTASAFTIDATIPDEPLTVGEKTDIPVTITFGQDDCLAIASSAGTDATVTITSDLGDEWGFSGTDVTISDMDCISGGASASANTTVSVTPSEDVIANIAVKPTLSAAIGEGDAVTYSDGSLVVGYVPGHTMTTDITFPYTYEGEGAMTFNVTLDVGANGDTMVMFLNVDAGDASISGLEHQKFFFTTGDEATRTMQVTWTPPSKGWDNSTVSFRNYSHCLADGVTCDPEFDENIVWTINNGNPATSSDPPGEDSPGVGPVAFMALLGAALVALRRRS